MDKTALDYFVDRYRLDLSRPLPIEIPNVSRDSLGEWFRDLGYKRGAEIGVERGVFSEILLRQNPEAEHYCIDYWNPYPEYNAWCNRSHLPQKFEETKDRLSKYPNVKFMRMFSMKAVKYFEDNSLDYVYIDANHELPWCMDDIVEWNKKVKPGGILAGHDYIQKRHTSGVSLCDVIQAVYWYTTAAKINPWFLIGTRAKVPGELRDKTRSFFWVKS